MQHTIHLGCSYLKGKKENRKDKRNHLFSKDIPSLFHISLTFIFPFNLILKLYSAI